MIINHEISRSAFWRSRPVASADKPDKSGFSRRDSIGGYDKERSVISTLDLSGGEISSIQE